MANILITGTSSGIGEDAALRLDRDGHRVFAGVRTQPDADRLAARASDRLTPVICDVADDDSVAAATETIDAAVGSEGLQGVVNNAGVARAGPLEHLPLSEWRDQFDINVFGQIAVTRAVMPMIRRGRGRVCFIGSVAGRIGNPLMGPYAGSKFAIEGIAQALRAELRPWNIPVSVVEPGPIKTPIWQKGRDYAPEIRERFGAEAMEQYGDQVDKLVKGLDANERMGAPVSKTSDAIAHALFASRPKHRYLVGTPAKVIGNVTKFLPDKVNAVLIRLAG